MDEKEEKASLWLLLWRVIYRPSQALGYVGREMGWLWLGPVIVLALSLAFHSFAISPQAAALSARLMEQRMLDMPPEQAEAVGKSMAIFNSPPVVAAMSFFSGLIVTAILWLIGAGALYTIVLFAGGESNFKQMFFVISWAWLPFIVRYLVQGFYTLLSGQLVVYQGLSGLVATGDQMADSGNLFLIALAQVDIFYLWHLLLVGLGVAALSRFSRFRGVVLGLIYGAVMVGVSLVPGFLGRVFSGG